MIFKFPPSKININDHSFLAVDDTIFAKLKIENKTTTKTVFLTENVLVLVLAGTKHLHIENETVLVNSSEIIFLRKGIYAMAEYFEEGLDFKAVLLFLNSKIVQEVVSDYDLKKKSKPSHKQYLKLPTNASIEIFKEQIQQYFIHQNLKDKGLFLLKQKEILIYILKTIPIAKAIEFWNSLMSNSYEDMGFILKKYLFYNFSVEDYAKLTNRSLSAFKRDFKKAYQCPPKKWINLKRLEHAHFLMINTNETVSQISFKCGFENLSYFIKSFRKVYGITPAMCRSNCYIK